VREIKYEADPDQTLHHRHFLTSRARKGGSATLDRIPLLFNQDIAMLYVEPDENDAHFYRNAQATELVYVSKGKGVLESTYGSLPVSRRRLSRNPPRHPSPLSIDLNAEQQPKLVVFESRGTCDGRSAYRNEFGPADEGAPYSERDIRRPTFVEAIDRWEIFRFW